MLKAFIPVAVLLLSVVIGLESPSRIQLAIVFTISVGVAISSGGELLFSMTGFIFQVASILCESSRLVLSDQLLKDLKLDPLSMLYYMSPICLVFISIAFTIFESKTMKWEVFNDRFLLGMLLLSSTAAFGLNIAVVMLITNASALIMTLGGIAKDIMLIILSVTIFRTPVTGVQVFGYSISLAGMNLYKNFKTDPKGFTEATMSYLNYFRHKNLTGTVPENMKYKDEVQNLLS